MHEKDFSALSTNCHRHKGRTNIYGWYLLWSAIYYTWLEL